LLRHPGESPLFLVSGMLEEKVGSIADSSEVHAELKRLLGPKCLTYSPPTAEPEMEQVS